MKAVCAICGEETEGEYFRVGHLLSPPAQASRVQGVLRWNAHWMQLADEYFGDYVNYYKEMEEEVRRGYEK